MSENKDEERKQKMDKDLRGICSVLPEMEPEIKPEPEPEPEPNLAGGRSGEEHKQ